MPPRVRVHAGQLDLKDASRFTVRYVIDDVTTILDGWLDNEDRVWLMPRTKDWRSLP